MNVDATIDFIENFNNTFDIQGNKNEIFTFLDEMKNYICLLKIYVKSRRISKKKVIMKILKKKVVESTCRKQVS